MVHPFNDVQGKKKLKSASYEIDFLGDVYWTDDKGDYHAVQIKKGDHFNLRKNSIVFIYLKTEFRLPNYLAIRFNLKITCVHRGLLLGTGPLVDPGFCGRLLIPLHNLTFEDYHIYGGDGLIWVEFTKLSPHTTWSNKGRTESAPYVEFPDGKMWLSEIEYFAKASGGRPARSSIPGEITLAKDSAKAAQATAKWFAGIGFLSIIGIIWGTWSLISGSNQIVAAQNTTISDLRVANTHLELRVKQLENAGWSREPKQP
jgi:deoxycytidine triphosphate deaminase